MTKQTKLAVTKQKGVSLNPNDVLPPELMRQLEEKAPAWLKELEADGTAVLRWNWEHLMLIQYILEKKFHFTEKDQILLEGELKKLLPIVTTIKAKTPRLIMKKDYETVLKNVRINKKLYLNERQPQLEAKGIKKLK